jgi:replicative DNA helicase
MIYKSVPTHNREAEESIISAVLIDNRVFDDIDFLTPDDFYVNTHRHIYQSIQRLALRKKPVDLVTVCTDLQECGNLEKAGGASYISQIADCAPVAINARAYAEAVKEASIRRRISDAAASIIAKASERGLSTQDLVSYAQGQMMGINSSSVSDTIVSAGDLGADCFDAIFSGKQLGKRVLTGYGQLDQVLEIMGPMLVIIAARPSVGKTAFALSIVKRMGFQDLRVGFLSLEMSRRALAKRWIAMMSEVNTMRMSAGTSIEHHEKARMYDAVQAMATWRVYVDDSHCKIDDVQRKARALVKDFAIDALFIDQLSHIAYDSRLDDTPGTTKAVKAISALKKELSIPIFLLAQINRKAEDRADKMPVMSDLKQTGRIEEDADAVILLHRPHVLNKKHHPEEVSVNLVKNRDGATFEISTINDSPNFNPYGIRFTPKTTEFVG